MQRFLKKVKRNKKGFTLIELIVVIAILAILAALIVPRIMGFIDKAGNAAEAANGKLLYNVTVLALSTGDITLPVTTALSLIAIPATENGSALATYLDEWPNDRDGVTPLVLIIDTDGAVEVETAAAVHLAGAELTSTITP